MTPVSPLSNVDYSSIFNQNLGSTLGLTIFRMENLIPVLLDAHYYGQFCIADCYIILNSIEIDDKITHQLFTWIGSEAETDKKFCAAMYSVVLRNLLESPSKIIRETESDESDLFLSLFSTDLTLLDETFATETGLFMAEEKKYPTRLYELRGKKGVTLHLVKLIISTLKSECVYVLDSGLELYQWNGLQSSLQHRSKGRMLLGRINKQERSCKASVIELDQNDEDDRFWEFFSNRDQDQIEGKFYLTFHLFKNKIDFKGDLVELSNRTILYRVFPKVAPDLESHIVSTEKLKQTMLIKDGCYVLDFGVELFMWFGKDSWKDLRKVSTDLFAKVVASVPRPKWVGFTKCVDGAEPEVFKLRFEDWEIKNDFTQVKLKSNYHISHDSVETFNGRNYRQD
ncbi:hypothetical protein BC833DRAFT_525213 [Globomyces pollinis-pini]|nr:hypothetical protein BC833DRAFT_525213 [Globomyces pollinis-pini]